MTLFGQLRKREDFRISMLFGLCLTVPHGVSHGVDINNAYAECS